MDSECQKNNYRHVIITLGKECRPWCDGHAGLEIRQMAHGYRNIDVARKYLKESRSSAAHVSGDP